MDQLLRCSPNNSLLARRKNNTASKLLQERLQNLEQKYHRGYRQFLRERSRVQIEMKEMQDISGVFDDKVAPDVALKKAQLHNTTREKHHAHFLWHQGFQKLKLQQRMASVNLGKSSKTTPSAKRPPFQHSCSRPNVNTHYQRREEPELQAAEATELDNQQSPIENTSIFHVHQGHIPPFVPTVSPDSTSSQETRQPVNSPITDHSTKTALKDRKYKTDEPYTEGFSRLSSDSSSPVFCKLNPQSRVICQHFPCVTPTNYHNIGRKTNNTNYKNHNNPNTVSTRLSASGPKLHSVAQTIRGSSDHTVMATGRSDLPSVRAINNDQNQEFKELSRVSRSGHNSNNQTFELNEANLGLKQVDPILEKVRSCSIKPVVQSGYRASTSVKAKVRGLNNMSAEMRAKNDRMKPRDWAVNYGKQVPLRVLLNPALPSNNVT